jgi:hypothetical protein
VINTYVSSVSGGVDTAGTTASAAEHSDTPHKVNSNCN